MAVIEVAAVEPGDCLAGDQSSLAVIKTVTVERQGAVSADRTCLIEQIATTVQQQLTGTAQTTGTVVDTTGTNGQGTLAADEALDVEQGFIKCNVQAVETFEIAVAVIQHAARQRPRPFDTDQAFVLIVDGSDCQRQVFASEHLASVGVVQMLPTDGQQLAGRELPGAVVDLLDIHRQCFRGSHQPTVAVIEGLAGQTQVTLRHQCTALLLQKTNRGEQITLTGNTPQRVLHLGESERDRADSADQAAAVIQT
ncbi:hypothetical protein D3C72_1077760 [compost metagenome]